MLRRGRWRVEHARQQQRGRRDRVAPELLGRRCPLFGCKFMRDAAQALLPALESTAVLRPG